MDIDAYRRKRLKELVDKEAGGNVAAFARMHNQDPVRLRQILNANYRSGKGFREGVARRLEADLKLAPLYFDLGLEEELLGKHISAPTELPNIEQKSGFITTSPGDHRPSINVSPETEANVSEPLSLRAGRDIAVVGEVQGGPDGFISIDDYPPGQGHGWLHIYSPDPTAYGLRVRGDSMRPRIKSGEYIVVEPGLEALPGDDVVVKFTDGSAVVKELLWVRDDEICLGSINNGVPPMTRPLNIVLSIHRVGAIVPRGSGMYRSV
ncbi:S24 family peptidase [Caballeronia glathei]|uniref:Repressor n=1 Tax=Caballeronia glathei TaxID=60547 RepID=A0A069PNW5_9BURK|nr:S24 family peptidase [Caballeronia glathei]KDR41564.1 repressor [Caballeronia glathei]